jgi:hypothetical protein
MDIHGEMANFFLENQQLLLGFEQYSRALLSLVSNFSVADSLEPLAMEFMTILGRKKEKKLKQFWLFVVAADSH